MAMHSDAEGCQGRVVVCVAIFRDGALHCRPLVGLVLLQGLMAPIHSECNALNPSAIIIISLSFWALASGPRLNGLDHGLDP